MIETYILKEGTPPTPEQLREVEEASQKEITYDEDCPELSPALLKSLRVAAAQRNRLLRLQKA